MQLCSTPVCHTLYRPAIFDNVVLADAAAFTFRQVGKGYAAQAAKARNKADAYAAQEEGFASLQSVFKKGVPALDQLKVVAQELRRLPTVEVATPTVSCPCREPSMALCTR